MEKEASQPTGCVRPGPEPALDLHLGSECEPQQPVPSAKELLGMGMGELNTATRKDPGGKSLYTDMEQVVRKSSPLPGTIEEEAPSLPRIKLPVEMSPL